MVAHLVTYGLPGAVIFAVGGPVGLASPGWPAIGWAGAVGWIVGILTVGLVRRERPWPLPDDLPEPAQLRALQAVHDEPVVDDADVARGVLGYVHAEPRVSRRGPWWLWLVIWLTLSVTMVLLFDDLLRQASTTRAVVVHSTVLTLITAGVLSEWRLRSRAQAAKAAATQLLAAEGER